MKIALVTLLTFCSCLLYGQRVANFAYGKYDSPDFESYSFWVKSNKMADIDYTYTTKTGQSKSHKLKYMGIDYWNGKKAFKVKFPNDLILYIIPFDHEMIRITSLDGSYSKYFNWLYEGPVNGVGTWCEPCTEDGKESVKLLKMYYLNEDIKTVDENALFKVSSGSGKGEPIGDKKKTNDSIDASSIYGKPSTGLALNVSGWGMGARPQINDDSDESGRIVFEVIVDDTGDIVNVKVKEANVSQRLVDLHRRAVARMKLVPKSENVPSTSKGTITFNIKSK